MDAKEIAILITENEIEINDVLDELDLYTNKLISIDKISSYIDEVFALDIEEKDAYMTYILNRISNIDFQTIKEDENFDELDIMLDKLYDEFREEKEEQNDREDNYENLHPTKPLRLNILLHLLMPGIKTNMGTNGKKLIRKGKFVGYK